MHWRSDEEAFDWQQNHITKALSSTYPVVSLAERHLNTQILGQCLLECNLRNG